MNEQNNRMMPDFEGYSPSEMYNLIHFPFGPDSPISIQKISESDYSKIPMLNQMKYFLNLIKNAGEIKLTAKGFLPTKVVKEIYGQEFLEEMFITSGLYQLYKESDSLTVNLTRILAQIARLTKKRHGKLSLTKNGEKIISDNGKLLDLIINTITTKFNWAYYDGYRDDQIGQLGFGFSLIMLHKYGKTKRQDAFYAKKYFRAFPAFIDPEFPSNLTNPEMESSGCYSLRTFDRFLDYFGLIKIETVEKKWDSDKYITKTDLFDKLIKVHPHNPQ